MRIINIALDDQEEPEEVTVAMTLQEVVAIARLFGRLNGHGMRRVGIPDDGNGPYGALTGGVLNRFWDDGVGHFNLAKLDLATINDPTKAAV
jgi:hypothetical protein